MALQVLLAGTDGKGGQLRHGQEGKHKQGFHGVAVEMEGRGEDLLHRTPDQFRSRGQPCPPALARKRPTARSRPLARAGFRSP